MMQFILLFSLILPVFGAGRRSADIEEERAALRLLQTKFQRFSATAGEVDAKFAKLRLAVGRHRYTEASEIAADLSRQIGVSRKQWREVETFYADSQKIRMNFHRQNLAKDLELDENLVVFLRFQRNDRFGTGTPLELQLAAWLGVPEGKKAEAPPANTRRRGEIGGFPVRAGDSLLMIMNDGGFVRGRLEGFNDGLLVLREVLPNTLGIIQRNEGWFRILGLTDTARVEVIRRPATIADQEAPAPTVTSAGNYSSYYVAEDHAFRIDLHPDNMQLLKLVKERRFADVDYEAKIAPIDLTRESRPAYAEMYFIDCEDLLRRTP
jgi:hypothetical protein